MLHVVVKLLAGIISYNCILVNKKPVSEIQLAGCRLCFVWVGWVNYLFNFLLFRWKKCFPRFVQPYEYYDSNRNIETYC